MNLIAITRPRYWEDSFVNGESDTDGKLIPCRKDGYWSIEIDTETGKILNWPIDSSIGISAAIHYKVVDCGSYYLYDDNNELIFAIEEDYVPDCMCPKGEGYGDYIIMDILANGQINNWKFDINKFKGLDDD